MQTAAFVQSGGIPTLRPRREPVLSREPKVATRGTSGDFEFAPDPFGAALDNCFGLSAKPGYPAVPLRERRAAAIG
jgi:hypothetical protein